MKPFTIFGALVLATASQALTFTGDGFDIKDATSAGQSNSGSRITISGTGLTIASLNSLTLTGLDHSRAGDLLVQFNHVETELFVSMVFVPDSTAAFGGTYVFKDDAPTKVNDALAGHGAGYTLPSGDYRVTGSGDPVYGTALSQYAGVALDGRWNMTIIDDQTGASGSLGSWSMDVTPQAVPEPAPLAVLGLGLAASRHRRR